MQENLDKMVLVEIQKNKIGCSVFLKEMIVLQYYYLISVMIKRMRMKKKDFG